MDEPHRGFSPGLAKCGGTTSDPPRCGGTSPLLFPSKTSAVFLGDGRAGEINQELCSHVK